jgi:hypothetical protein
VVKFDIAVAFVTVGPANVVPGVGGEMVAAVGLVPLEHGTGHW